MKIGVLFILILFFTFGCINLPAEVKDCQTTSKIVAESDYMVRDSPDAVKIMTTILTDTCILDKVEKSNDTSLCQYIQDTNKKAECNLIGFE